MCVEFKLIYGIWLWCNQHQRANDVSKVVKVWMVFGVINVEFRTINDWRK